MKIKTSILITGIFIAVISIIACIIIFSRNSFGNDKIKSPFWQTEIMMQIYPRSFLDTNNDGIGDLRGISEKVDYIKELDVNQVWISPFYLSPMADFGYDVANFTEIDPIFGTMEDFDQLLKKFHSKGMKVIIDFVPNHSSNEHEWFQKSEANETYYADFYVWKNAKGFNDSQPIPPNNWVSAFGNSSWQWSDIRQQFYYHNYLIEQPDLNYRNPNVVQEMNNVMRFWLDLGVDGFRIDAIKCLVEVNDVYHSDEPPATNSGTDDPNDYAYLNHTYTLNQPENYEILHGWRNVIDEYSNRVLIAEATAGSIEDIMHYYGNETEPLADYPFNFYFIHNFQNRSDLDGFSLKAMVDLWMDNMPEGKWPNWVLGSHDTGRVASRLGSDVIDSMNIFNLLLPGTPVTYYGEEIGMEDTFISYEDSQDPSGCHYGPDRYTEFSRDPERTPMQWNSEVFAGFTQGNSTWLPVNENYHELNVESQMNSTQETTLSVYKALAKLRTKEIFRSGLISFPVITNEVFSFMRFLDIGNGYLIVLNTDTEQIIVDLHKHSFMPLPETATVLIRSSSDQREETELGSEIDLSEVSLLRGEGLVLEFN